MGDVDNWLELDEAYAFIRSFVRLGVTGGVVSLLARGFASLRGCERDGSSVGPRICLADGLRVGHFLGEAVNLLRWGAVSGADCGLGRGFASVRGGVWGGLWVGARFCLAERP